nr:acylneuraminate cytidylyltransferase family protein [Pseudodesulfovibrio sp.]
MDAHIIGERSKQTEALAIIPARGGSKGIPHKNIYPLCGKPLIAYSIETALAASSIDRVVVSTDDKEIAAVAREYGAEVPYLRPESLASDSAEISGCINHMLQWLYDEQGYVSDLHTVLYPTHLFRKVSLVDSMVQKVAVGGYYTATTVRQIDVQESQYYAQDCGCLQVLHDRKRPLGRGQYYRGYGSVLVRSNHFMPYSRYASILTDEIEFIDIDEWDDFYLAEEVITQGLYDFEL